jgi:hypothetical protein
LALEKVEHDESLQAAERRNRSSIFFPAQHLTSDKQTDQPLMRNRSTCAASGVVGNYSRFEI